MLYSELPEYKLAYRDLRGAGLDRGDPRRPAAAASPQVPADFFKKQGGGFGAAALAAAPHLLEAGSGMMTTPAAGTSSNYQWLGSLGKAAGAAGTAMGGTAGKLGNLGEVAAGLVSKDQDKANMGRQIANIMQTYQNDPEARRDALTAFLAANGMGNPRGR